MKKTIRKNIATAYSLHDMNIVEIQVNGNDITMKTLSGVVETTPPYGQPDGYIEFHNVQWDFSYVYLLNTGNIGPISGEKMFLKDFILKYPNTCFNVLDETYGYNSTKYSGFRTIGDDNECIIEIYHEGDMVFVTNE